jgi:hypothetical protein
VSWRNKSLLLLLIVILSKQIPKCNQNRRSVTDKKAGIIRALFLAKFILASRLDAVVVLDNSYRKKKIIFPKPATNAQPQGP